MVQIKDATDKLKKIVAGATLMAGIAMGTGCDNAQQQLQKNPTEDVVNDNDTDGNYANDENTDKPVENNDTDKPIENNDSDRPVENDDTDKPVENNDSDKPTENNDEDKPVENNDTDKPSETNDSDKPIENNDNDEIINDDDTDINNPDETNDDDNVPTVCATEDIALTAQGMQELTPERIQERIANIQEEEETLCPHGDFQKKERLDANGNYCIEDKCIINSNEIVPDGTVAWIDNLSKMAFTDAAYIPDYNITYYKKTEHLNKAGPTDLTIKTYHMTMYVKDVPTASCFAPNNIVENASTNTMIVGETCHSGGQSISPSGIVAKNAQPKFTDTEFSKACYKVPNSEYSSTQKQCSTTITEFAWLENVIPYLHNKSYAQRNLTPLKTTKIEKNWDNNTFYVYLSVDDKHKWVVELSNAKRCLDECYGIEGCEVSIKPNPDLSNGCIVKEPENASLMRPNTKTNKQKNHARVDMKKLPKRNLTISRVAQSLARRHTR